MKSAAAIILGLVLPLASTFSVSSEVKCVSDRREFSKAIGSCLLFGGSMPPLVLADTATERGIKSEVINPPTDPTSETPMRGQKVKAKYTLWINGFPEDTAQAKKIDSSKGPFGEKAFEFFAGVSQVIKGWDLSILEMRVGESRKLVIPAELGYGAKGTGPIPGGATLYFKVELAEIGAKPNLTADQQKWLADNPL